MNKIWIRIAIGVGVLLILFMLGKCHQKSPPMVVYEGFNGDDVERKTLWDYDDDRRWDFQRRRWARQAGKKKLRPKMPKWWWYIHPKKRLRKKRVVGPPPPPQPPRATLVGPTIPPPPPPRPEPERLVKQEEEPIYPPPERLEKPDPELELWEWHGPQRLTKKPKPTRPPPQRLSKR